MRIINNMQYGPSVGGSAKLDKPISATQVLRSLYKLNRFAASVLLTIKPFSYHNWMGRINFHPADASIVGRPLGKSLDDISDNIKAIFSATKRMV